MGLDADGARPACASRPGSWAQMDGAEWLAAEDCQLSKGKDDWLPLIVTAPQRSAYNTELHCPRGKCLDGSSARNYMAWMWADAVLWPLAALLRDEPQVHAAQHGPALRQLDARVRASSTTGGLLALGMPVIRGFQSGSLLGQSYFPGRADVEVAVAGYKRVRQFWNSTAVRDFVVGHGDPFPGLDPSTDAQLEDMIKKSFNTIYHAACTCAMGKPDDRLAVVDSHARVFGVNALRAVDASAFPLLPPGHPMATAYALAEKIAPLARSAAPSARPRSRSEARIRAIGSGPPSGPRTRQ